MSAPETRLLLVGLVPPEAGGSIACGVATHVWELARQASVSGYDVSILAPLRPDAPSAPGGIRMIDASRSRPARIWLGGVSALRRMGRREGPPAGTGWGSLIPILSWTERIRRAIGAVHPDILHIHPLSHPCGPGLQELPREIPVVLTDHGFWQDLRRPGDLDKVRETARLARGIIAVSRHCLEREDRNGIVTTGLRRVINNPVSLPSGGAARARSASGRRQVLFAAGVEPVTRKGLDLLIRAFVESRRLRSEAELIVITDKPSGQWAARAMASAGIAGGAFPLRPVGEMAAAYAAADVFALPSRSEAFPLVFLESLAAGTPIVGFAPAVTELAEILGSDIGRPFDALTGTASGLAEELLQVLGRLPERAGLASRTAAAFTWDALFPSFDRFYKAMRPA